MFSWLTNAWRVPELRRRVLFTAIILALYRLGSWMPAPGVDSEQIKNFFNSGRAAGRPRPAEPLLRRRALALLALRARDHAVRHGVDHPAAPDGRRAVARAAAEGGRGRLREDQPVHALPDGRARGAQSLGYAYLFKQEGVLRGERRPPRPDRHHADRRHDAAHVDGRADHEARHRQRHLAPHLRVDPLDDPGRRSPPGSTAARPRSSSSRSSRSA